MRFFLKLSPRPGPTWADMWRVEIFELEVFWCVYRRQWDSRLGPWFHLMRAILKQDADFIPVVTCLLGSSPIVAEYFSRYKWHQVTILTFRWDQEAARKSPRFADLGRGNECERWWLCKLDASISSSKSGLAMIVDALVDDFGWGDYPTLYNVYGGFLKWGYHQIIHFRLGFSIVNHPAIGVPPFVEPPLCYI